MKRFREGIFRQENAEYRPFPLFAGYLNIAVMFFNGFSRGHQADSGSFAALGGKKTLKYFLSGLIVHAGACIFHLVRHCPSLRLKGPEGYFFDTYPFSHNFSQLFESGYNTSIPLMESYVRELENHSIPKHSLDMLTTAPSDTRPDDQKVRSVQSDSFANEIENSFGPLKPEDLSELRVINPTRAEESPISDVSVDHI